MAELETTPAATPVTEPTTTPTPATPAPTPETAPAEAKPAEAAPLFALDKLTLPEGLDKKDPTLAAFADAAKGLPQTQAQALLDLYTKQTQASGEAATKAWDAVHEKWLAEVKADPVIGGDKSTGVQQVIAKAFETYGTPGLKAALNLTGVGNNPDVIRTFYNMAKALTEGNHVSGAPATSIPKSAAQTLYPNLP